MDNRKPEEADPEEQRQERTSEIGLVHNESKQILDMFADEGSHAALSGLGASFGPGLASPANDIDLFNQMLSAVATTRRACFADLPHSVVQSKILMLFSSRELFKLRLVSTEWCDLIKTIWCQVVKEEMLAQVQNLDLLYEKETTSKILEFKMKYLVSYAQLMRNYFVNMVFSDICQELKNVDEAPENADLESLGAKLILIVHLIVCPNKFDPPPETAAQITADHLKEAMEAVQTPEFQEKFRGMCQMDVIPDVTLNQIKIVKGNLIDPLLTARPEFVQRLGNAGRLLNSWIDGVLEYTILKHEVVVLRLKSKRVVEQIQTVSQVWPKKKAFIEGAYKLLLFSKGQRPYATGAIKVFKEDHGPEDAELKAIEQEEAKEEADGQSRAIVSKNYFDYSEAFGRVMKTWYEKRIQEETAKNVKLQELHDSLIQIRDLQVRQAEMNKMGGQEQQHEIIPGVRGDSSAAGESQDPSQLRADEVEQKLAQQQAMQKEIEGLRSKIHDAQNQIQATRTTIDAQRAMIEQAKQLTAQANNLCGEVNSMREQLTTLRAAATGIQHRRPEPAQAQQQLPESAEAQDSQVQESQERPPEEQIQQPSEAQSSSNRSAIQQFLNVEPPHQQVAAQATQEAQQPLGSSLAEDAQIDSSSRPAATQSAQQDGVAPAQVQRDSANVENDEIMQSILQVGGIFSKQSEEAGIQEKQGEEDEDLSSSDSDADPGKKSPQPKKDGTDQSGCQNCSTCGGPAPKDDEKAERKKRRDKKKPEQLRKQLFEILLRKRIFLTDRFEKIEKSLIMHGIITGKQLANQQVEMLHQAQRDEFELILRQKLLSSDYVVTNPDSKDVKEEKPESKSKDGKEDEPKASAEKTGATEDGGSQVIGSSLIDEPKETEEVTEKPILSVALRRHLLAMSKEDNWYELYKSITNEKDMAEKDQQRMIRRERRRIRRRQKLRKERIEAIVHTLKIRKAYRKRAGIKLRSTSVDRYHDYTDREYEQRLVEEQMNLRQQIVAQHQNNQNIQNVLMGLAAVRMLLDTAASTTGAAQGPQPAGPQTGPTTQQFQAALQAEQFLQTAQQQIAAIMGTQATSSADNEQEPSPENMTAAQQLTRQGATILQNPLSFVAQARNQAGEDMATQTEQVDMGVQTESQASSAQTGPQMQDRAEEQKRDDEGQNKE